MAIETVERADAPSGRAKTHANGTETEPGNETTDESLETETAGEIPGGLRTHRGLRGTMPTATERRCLRPVLCRRCRIICTAGLRFRPCTMADTCNGTTEDRQARHLYLPCLTR